MSYSKNTFRLLGKYSNGRRLLLNPAVGGSINSARYFSVIPFLGRILRLRYLFLGGAIGGGVAINNVSRHKVFIYLLNGLLIVSTPFIQKYEQFKSNLPDMTWMKDFLPEDAYNQLTNRFNNVYDSIHPPNLVLQGRNLILYET